jgi:sugar/nucleoside kinase (ribokinase family)
MNTGMILGVGNIYLETNYLGLETAGSTNLQTGKEYRSDTYEIRLGGSVINFLLQLKNLGNQVGLIGKIGIDEPGDKIIDLLHASGINTDLIIRSKDVQTCIDTGLVFKHTGDNIQLVSGNANQNLNVTDLKPLYNLPKSTLGIYFGGFFKQEVLIPEYPKIFRQLNSQGIKIYLDHGRLPVNLNQEKINYLTESLKYVDCYFPNETEILGLTQLDTIEAAAEKIFKYGPKIIAVKLGKHGAFIKISDNAFHIDGYNIAVLNVVGAGDSFNSGFIVSIINGKTIKDSAIFANAVAALKVSTNTYPKSHLVTQFIDLHR